MWFDIYKGDVWLFSKDRKQYVKIEARSKFR